jgi:membrane associated rhomboid family serine protease
LPVVTFGLAALIAATFGYLQLSASNEGGVSEETLLRAHAFYEQNPQVRVSSRDRQLLGPDFVDEIAEAYAQRGDSSIVFSDRIRQRTQERFEAVTRAAYEAKLEEFPAWRLGVAPTGATSTSYFTHAFVHETLMAMAVSWIFLVLAGIGLEGAMGSLVFGGLCLLGILVPGAIFAATGGAGSLPLSGASGLVGLLLGAYLVRGASAGGFMLPGWLLLPVWGFVEYFFVRGIWVDNVDAAPVTTHGAAIALGAVVALVLKALGVEKKLIEWVDEGDESAMNPALAKAARQIERGQQEEAFQTLQTAWDESRKDEQIALAFWNLAKETGNAGSAVGAVLPIIRVELRRGDLTAASEHWRELMGAAPDAPAEPTLLIRIAESLLDEGHPEDAIQSLRKAVEHPDGLGTSLAQRVVRIARDLDPNLTQEAASIALNDAELDPATRDSLEALCAEVRTSAPQAMETPATARPPAPKIEPTTEETTDFPLDADIDMHSTAELTDPGEFDALSMAAAPDGSRVSVEPEQIDPNALSIQSLEREFSGDLGLDPSGGTDAATPADAESTESWNEPHALPGLGSDGSETDPMLFDEAGPGGGHLDNSHLDHGALSGDALSQEAHLSPEPDPSPLVSDGPQPIDPSALPPLAMPGASPSRAPIPTSSEPEALDDDDLAATIADELAIGGGLRKLKLVEGSPLSVTDGVLDVEIKGKGKSRVPFDRVDAVAVAAVAGLSEKPVLIIDLVLNWMSVGDEPLKVIRLYSNRFNPKRLSPDAASPLAALQAFAAELMQRSGATPLPGADAVSGNPFASYPSLDAYQREVLMAED